jgi:phosphatidylserine/phosphatidylglycerophosphate/cardiolipin synthase-like enzyme
MNIHRFGLQFIISAVLISHYPLLSVYIESYFSPVDHIQEKLIERIDRESKSIKASLYLIFDKKVVEALCRAVREREVTVELIADSENIEYKWGQIPVLHEAGITVYIYNAKQGIMHDKYFLFECNKNYKPAVWTGSYNITLAANRVNRENVVIIGDDYPTLRNFEKDFETIKKEAKLYPSRVRRRPARPDFGIDNVMGGKFKERPNF